MNKNTKQLLFERMNKIGGMPLNENNRINEYGDDYLPAGAAKDPNAMYNQQDPEEIRDWDIDNTLTITLHGDKGGYHMMDVDEVISQNSQEYKTIFNNSNNPNLKQMVEPYVEKWIADNEQGTYIEWGMNENFNNNSSNTINRGDRLQSQVSGMIVDVISVNQNIFMGKIVSNDYDYQPETYKVGDTKEFLNNEIWKKVEMTENTDFGGDNYQQYLKDKQNGLSENSIVGDEYKNTLIKLAKQHYPDNWELVVGAADDWVSAKGIRRMSGRGYAEKLFKNFNRKYDVEIQSAAQEIVDIADNDI